MSLLFILTLVFSSCSIQSENSSENKAIGGHLTSPVKCPYDSQEKCLEHQFITIDKPSYSDPEYFIPTTDEDFESIFHNDDFPLYAGIMSSSGRTQESDTLLCSVRYSDDVSKVGKALVIKAIEENFEVMGYDLGFMNNFNDKFTDKELSKMICKSANNEIPILGVANSFNCTVKKDNYTFEVFVQTLSGPNSTGKRSMRISKSSESQNTSMESHYFLDSCKTGRLSIYPRKLNK